MKNVDSRLLDPVLSCDGVGDTEVTFSFDALGAKEVDGGGAFVAILEDGISFNSLLIEILFKFAVEMEDETEMFFFGGNGTGAAAIGVNLEFACGTDRVMHT